MDKSSYSLLHYFNELGQKPIPRLRYKGGDVADWQSRLREKVLELLGTFPESVDLNVKTIWRTEEDGLIKEKVIFHSEENSIIPAIVMKRADLDPKVKHKGMICLHGHGPGKGSVTGSYALQNHEEGFKKYDDYALQFARRGYVTLSPDFRNFGERRDADLYPGRDSCNVHFIRGLLMGINLITLNIWDVQKSIDYFSSRSDVDPERIGCVGLSLGGTMTLHVSAIDSRIKAAGIICAITTYKEYAINQGNFCGSQFIPGIYEYADIPDLAGLIAPRALLVESGVYDEGFPIEASQEAHEHIRNIYRSAGAEDRLTIDVFEGGHEFSGRKAFTFFENKL